MKRSVVLCFVVFGFFASSAFTLGRNVKKSDSLELDSAHSIILNASIDNGFLRTEAEQTPDIIDEIHTQLFYLVGPLNAHGGVGEIAHAKIKILSVTPIDDSTLNDVKYTATFVVGWPTERDVPLHMDLVLPRETSDDAMEKFFVRFKENCSQSAEDGDLDSESFYYYYRPQKEKCVLSKMPLKEATAVLVHLSFVPSTDVTENKFPQYNKVWEDQWLIATMIFGTYKDKVTENSDPGVWSYNTTYQLLRQRFGNPVWMSPPLYPNAVPGIAVPDIEMTFVLPDRRVLNVNLLLTQKTGLQDPSEEFSERYNERTVNSDFISYNGHSGFGDNIKALAKLGTFVEGQYQLFYVNGCDTFAYVDDALRAAHAAVNPDSAPYRFFNIITNAMPSFFNDGPTSNLTLINALINRQETFAQILSHFNPAQRAIVIGEQDND